jgi:hypothetical protein
MLTALSLDAGLFINIANFLSHEGAKLLAIGILFDGLNCETACSEKGISPCISAFNIDLNCDMNTNCAFCDRERKVEKLEWYDY